VCDMCHFAQRTQNVGSCARGQYSVIDMREPMRCNGKRKGSALLMAIFIVALLSVIVMGILEMTTSDIQIMQNHVEAAQARMCAEAGLNEAVYELRLDADWDEGFEDKAFNGGTYTVPKIKKDNIESTGTTAKGFTCIVSAEFTALSSSPPHTIRLGALRINE
jgi:hypothetical protein